MMNNQTIEQLNERLPEGKEAPGFFNRQSTIANRQSKEVSHEYGHVDESMWGDEFLILKFQYLEDIIAALERRGYKC